jgi:hypothetical protein
MSPAHAVRTLMRNVLFFGERGGRGPESQRQVRVLDTVCSLAAAVPVSTLTFRKEPGVWDVIDRSVPGLVGA